LRRQQGLGVFAANDGGVSQTRLRRTWLAATEVGASCLTELADCRYRVGWAVGGWPLEPLAWAGLPGMKWLQPLLPETRILYGNSLSSMHNPIVLLAMEAFGSICHHLQSLHNPHSLLMIFLRLIG
jgi:hypothetical protein